MRGRRGVAFAPPLRKRIPQRVEFLCERKMRRTIIHKAPERKKFRQVSIERDTTKKVSAFWLCERSTFLAAMAYRCNRKFMEILQVRCGPEPGVKLSFYFFLFRFNWALET
jgi:hypothetical protein